MISLKMLIIEGRKAFEPISETPALDTELIVCHVLKLTKLDLFLRPDQEVSNTEAERVRLFFKRRAKGEPVQYLIGTEGFMGLDFIVTPSVLIPRPDTELLVEKILELIDNSKDVHILDIGTGSGAISISLAHYLKHAHVDTVDISKEATAVAKQNALQNQVEDRVRFLNGDLFEPLAADLKYDVIVSNPPYIPTEDIEALQVEVAVHEPRLALDGGMDGYDFYRRIIAKAPYHLIESGVLAFETGHDQAQTIKNMMIHSGSYRNVTIYKDLNDIERVVIGYTK
jgi:release factor glutamine methyltransferase